MDLPPWTGDPLAVDGVVRVPLDPALRLRKLYAIEAQHDLRPAPAYAPVSPVQRAIGELGRTTSALLRDPTDTYSYLRRAPRSNELFLLHEERNAPHLIAEIGEWLASRRGDPNPGAQY